MKYIIFLFLISMVFTIDVNAEAPIATRECSPVMQACMRDVMRHRSFNDSDRQVANAKCLRQYNDCAAANGGITQSSGRTAQMYHPANPDFIECRKTISDINSDAFTACMNRRTRAGKDDNRIYDGGQLQEIVVTAPRCSKERPDRCNTEEKCSQNNGVWDPTSRACAIAPCQPGTTPDADDPKYCKCDNEVQPYSLERGTQQQCPSQCKPEDHKVYNIVARGCICATGYIDRTGFGTCISSAAPAPKVDECLRELQDKVTSCSGAATNAVERCDAKRSGGDDSLGALQNLLGGVNGAVQARNAGTGAMDNCMNAAVASSSGYYALEELRGKCDEDINACKTSCADSTAFINANKERVYQACRKKAWDDHMCTINSPYRSFTEEAFNVEFDGINKAPFETQIQNMQKIVGDNNTKCENGTAVTNREKMTNYMDDMNNSVKSANQCQCQLGSSGQNCENQVGPAECTVNPNLPGCANATANCLNPSDTSEKCACFRNPNSSECKSSQQANNARINSTDASSFSGSQGSVPTTNSTDGGQPSGFADGSNNSSVTDLRGLNDNTAAIFANGNASGTETTGTGSPFGSAAGGGSVGGGSGGGGNAATDGAVAPAPEGGDEGTTKKVGGFFDVAKSALGNLFKKGNGVKGSFETTDGQGQNGVNKNGELDSKKWRPRGMVRGLASDIEIAGKHEDIWKVMNKQYKVQDQKDNFIFGEQK